MLRLGSNPGFPSDGLKPTTLGNHEFEPRAVFVQHHVAKRIRDPISKRGAIIPPSEGKKPSPFKSAHQHTRKIEFNVKAMTPATPISLAYLEATIHRASKNCLLVLIKKKDFTIVFFRHIRAIRNACHHDEIKYKIGKLNAY